ncbi:MAG: SMC family ATPase [Candidatus Micrarchaeota archaeon]
MIKSIRLVNWRSHADSRLEFRKGTNLLVGIMGAGKSSILEAISFALFGTSPALERRKVKLENIIRLNEPLARVELTFEWDGAEYRIERVIERSKKAITTHAEVYKSNSMVEHGSVAATAFVKNLIGVDYDLFTRAIYSEQNNIDYFLNIDPKRRKEEIDALLGLDRFELARANIVSVINQFRSKRDTLASKFSREKLDSLREKEKKQAEEIAEAKTALAKASAELEQHAKEASESLARFAEMKAHKERFDSLTKDSIRLQAQVDSLRPDLEGKTIDESAFKELEKRLQALGEERTKMLSMQKAAEDRNAALSKEGGSLDARMKAALDAGAKAQALQSELKSLLGTRSIEDIAASQKILEQALLSIESERKSLEREAQELSESLPKLKPGLSQCPLCSSKLTDDGISHVKAEKERLVKDKQARSMVLAADIAQKRKENDSLLQIIRRTSVISERESSLKQEAGSAEALKAKKAQLDASLAGLVEERKSLRTKLEGASEELEKARSSFNEQGRLIAKKKDADALAKRLADTRTALSQVRFDEKAFETLRESAERSKLDQERLLSAKRTLDSQIKSSSEMLRMVQEELSVLKALEKEMSDISALEEQLALYKNALLETQTGLRMGLADAINTAMNEIWGLFYPYKNYRALRLGVSEKDYLFEVDDGNGWKGLETIASGGERACAALALRAALAMVLTPKLGWLILDEPTHNLDSEAVELLSSALQFKVPEVVKQTFVITHDEAFMGSEFASSYRLKRDKSRNSETIIEAM